MEENGNKQSTPTEKPKRTEKDITGLKYFDQIAPLLLRLHDDACDRDTAGNRTLHYDQNCMLMLVYFFNPIVTSLRGLQQASELKNVQAKLGCARASLGSLSESTAVFDAERLKDIIGALGQQLQPLALDKRLQNIDHTITLVDGALILTQHAASTPGVPAEWTATAFFALPQICWTCPQMSLL